MDDSCAVCAEVMEWTAYGPCGHRDVCSNCVARLRFICQDRHCCICKTESHSVFVTKAMGDYTRVISDFSIFPSEPKEGRVGQYWYHEDTQAFFDDQDQYKMVKAMCKLSCSICDKAGELLGDAPKRRTRFRNVEQLKGHLFHKHRSFMCSLCLEGRKVFICEQKLYTRAQLNQHIQSGDSEVDGTESERGGFSGHPMCEYCRTPFYGDNEQYTHMSTEHETCFICRRQNPGQYEYFKNYDDLEIHFRHSHFLCEDEACLAKKFMVFQSEGDMKRHNTVEHGGRMSRSKRNAALQLPTSFRYHRENEQDQRRGRGRGRGRTFLPDFAEGQLSRAIEASLETVNADDNYYDPSTGGQVPPDTGDPGDMDSIINPMDSLSTNDSEASSRYLQALGHHSSIKPLEVSSFPPLSTGAGSGQSRPTQDSEGSSSSSMAAHLRRQSNRNLAANTVNTRQAWSASNRVPPNNSAQAWPAMGNASGVSRGSSQSKTSSSVIAPGPSYAGLAQAQPAMHYGQQSSSSSRDKGKSQKIPHSLSAPDLVNNESDFPPVSAAVRERVLPPLSNPVLQISEDVHTANKSLVEKIRSALEFNEENYTQFKEITGQYRQGLINTEIYLTYVQRFNLTHLLLDLARLCPDPQKQRELIETYNTNMRGTVDQGRDWACSNGIAKKGKAKVLASQNGSSKDNTQADNFLNSVRKLQSSNKPSNEEVEVLSKDGYRGKSKLTIVDQRAELNDYSQPTIKPGSSTNLPSTNGKWGDGTQGSSGGKQRKKTSKFHRVRLGDGSASSLLDLGRSDSPDPDPIQDQSDRGLPVKGVWRKGGQRLFP